MNYDIDILRSGSFTDQANKAITITGEDLDQLARDYVPDSAPLVLGHPTTEAPAYGWITALRRDGDRLIATLSHLAQPLIDAIKQHQYKHVSVGMGKTDTGYLLRHLGILGAHPPAVKGLTPLTSLNLAEGSEDQTNAQSVVLNTPVVGDAPKPEPEPAQATPELAERLRVLQQAYDALKQQYDALAAKTAERNLAEHHAGVKIAIDGAIAQGKIPPASRAYYEANCKDKTALDAFVAFAEAAPAHAVMHPSNGMGTPAQTAPQPSELSDEEKKIALQCGISTDEYFSARTEMKGAIQ